MARKSGKNKKEAADLAWKINNMGKADQMKGSQTWLVPKCENPDVRGAGFKDFRMVDPTNMGYKLFMSIMKERMGKMFAETVKEETTENNLLIMQDLLDKANAAKQTLIVMSVDYECDAYEKFNRAALIKLWQTYRVFIPAFANYFVDLTLLRYKKYKVRADVKNGLRPSCPIAGMSLHFMKDMIKQIIQTKGKVCKIDNLSMSSLWFADTAIILADSLKKARYNLKLFKEISEGFGLDIDKDKSYVVVYNDKIGITEVENIKVKKTN